MRITRYLVISSLFLTTACPGPTIHFGASLQPLDPNSLPRENMASVYPCPGEVFYLGWYCPECDSLSVTEDGSSTKLNSNSKGPEVIDRKTTVDVKYVAVGKKGDRTSRSEVSINALQNGDTVIMTGGLQWAPDGRPYWQADLPAFAYSGMARAYQASFHLSAPQVNVSSDWFIIDPANNTSVIRATWSPVPDPPLVGAWRVHNALLSRGDGLPQVIVWAAGVKCE